VDATVAYVAPISISAPDQRYLSFFESTVPEECREKIRSFPRDALMRRPNLNVLAAEALEISEETFEIMGSPEAVLEGAIASFEWSFWQYSNYSQCESIPEPMVSDEEIITYISENGLLSSSDQSLMRFQPYYFQSMVELGYPSSPSSHLSDLLEHPPAGSYLPNTEMIYDSYPMADILSWIFQNGSKIMLIYGEYDPWTAGRIPLGNAIDSFSFVAAKTNHGADINSLDEVQREEARSILRRWFDIEELGSPTFRSQKISPPRLLRILPSIR